MKYALYRILLVLAVLVPLALPVSGLVPYPAVSLRFGEIAGFLYLTVAFIVPAISLSIMTYMLRNKPHRGKEAFDAITNILASYDKAGTFYTRLYVACFNLALMVLALGNELYALAICLAGSLAAMMLSYGLAERARDTYIMQGKAHKSASPTGHYGLRRNGS